MAYTKLRRRHLLFLNPYGDVVFTRCPKCDGKTKVRRLPLVIHIEPDQLFVLNKTCRYCPCCDLVIVRQREVEPLMATTFAERRPEVVGNDYLILGTLDRADLKQHHSLAPRDLLKRTWVFNDQLNFKPVGGWELPR